LCAGIFELLGCQKTPPEESKASSETKAERPAVAVAPPTPPVRAVEAPLTRTASHFRANVLDEPPDPGQTTNRPPDVTCTNKSVARIFEAVAGSDGKPGLWDQVAFTDGKGRKIKHFATLKTEQGDIRIELLPDAAPNHVRNFVALARAGYYDGLPFHKSTREEVAGKTRGYLEAGCPKGTGEFGMGSVGYWLKPEIKDDVPHVDGSVGAWSSKDPQTGQDLANAACKFYISLGDPAGRDGNYTVFGKIVQGLDLAHTINRTIIREEDILAGNARPILIRQVVIEEVLDANLVAVK
jgi:cyclophilin family peptidyl-prolyl cis-trans isomerase